MMIGDDRELEMKLPGSKRVPIDEGKNYAIRADLVIFHSR